MEELEKRPLASLTSSFFVTACVLYAAEGFVRNICIIIAAVLFSAAVLIYVLKRRRSPRPHGRSAVLVLAGVLAASLFTSYFAGLVYPSYLKYSGAECTVSGTVRGSTESYSGREYYHLEVSAASSPLDGKLLLLKPAEGSCRVGDKVSADVTLAPLTDDGSLPAYYLSDGVVLEAKCDGLRVTGRDNGIRTRLYDAREKLSAILSAGMGRGAGGFAPALLLGNRKMLTAETEHDFRVLGISHLMAISGTHLSVVVLLLEFIIGKITRNGKVRFFVMCPAVVGYMALTGFGASVTRAGIMLIIYLLGGVFFRRADGITSLSAAVFLITIVNPFAPLDVGLQLSYAAMIAVLCAAGSKGVRGKVLTALLVPAFVLPLSAVYFGSMSAVSPLSNLVLAPLIAVFVPVCAVLLIISPVPWLFVPLASLAGKALGVLLSIISRIARSGDFLLPLTGNVTRVLITVTGVLMLVMLLSSGKTKKLVFLAAAFAFAVTLSSSVITGIAEERRLNVGCVSSWGEDAVIASSGGSSVLVHTGGARSYSDSLAVSLAGDWGCSDVDALVVGDGLYGKREVLRRLSEENGIRAVYLPSPENDGERELALPVEALARDKKIEVIYYGPGDVLLFGDAVLKMPETHTDGEYSRKVTEFTFTRNGESVTYTTNPVGYTGGGAVIAGSDVPDYGLHGEFPADMYMNVGTAEKYRKLGVSTDGAYVSDVIRISR